MEIEDNMELEHHDTVAFVLIQTKLGAANKVAEQLSALEQVRWAVVAMGGDCDVIAAVRVPDNAALGDFVIEQIETMEGIKNPATPQTLVMGSYYKEALRGRNDFP